MEEMTKNVQKLEELDTLIEQAREEADVRFSFVYYILFLATFYFLLTSFLKSFLFGYVKFCFISVKNQSNIFYDKL